MKFQKFFFFFLVQYYKLAKFWSLLDRFLLVSIGLSCILGPQITALLLRLVQRLLTVGMLPERLNGCFKDFPMSFTRANEFLVLLARIVDWERLSFPLFYFYFLTLSLFYNWRLKKKRKKKKRYFVTETF